MPHNIVGLDHTLVGVSDLEKARNTYQKLGFTVTPRGSHIGWGTANYCIMFEKDYVELLGIVDPKLESNGLDKLLEERGEGLLGMALSSDSPEETRTSLDEAGLNPTPLIDLKRKLELPEGDVIPEFKLIRLPVEGVSERNLFICHHLTPELIRSPEWEIHDNGVKAISSVVILVEEPAVFKEYYSKLCGTLNVTLTDETMTVRVGQFNMIFVSERDLDLLFPGLVIEGDWPEFPYLVAMTFTVGDVVKTEAHFETAGVSIQKISGGTLRVQPKDACGVLLEFRK
ncbi:MAG: VOC family protein [Sneathiella sp.]|nr:VOC family protein [Sneathiella sp.]